MEKKVFHEFFLQELHVETIMLDSKNILLNYYYMFTFFNVASRKLKITLHFYWTVLVWRQQKNANQ